MNYIYEMNKIKHEIDNKIPDNNITNIDVFKNNFCENFYFVTIINDFVLKIATINHFHYESLSYEIQILKSVKQFDLMPNIVFTYLSENIAIKIETYIDGQTLGFKRDDFKLDKNIEKKKIIANIEKISSVKF